MDAHPDLLYRQQGLEEYGRQNHFEAFRLFQRAGHFSDKPSQAIVGEMLWIGLGTQKNRGLAYVWMELAAERGYAAFVEKRDRYWRELDEQERQVATTQGDAIRAEYADEVAERRLHRVLRLARSRMTGSRLGSQASKVEIIVPGHGRIDGSRFYDPRFWDPRQYRQWHDEVWMGLRIGQVRVGEVDQVRESADPAQDPAVGPEPEPTPDTP